MWHPLQLECPECDSSIQATEVLVSLPLTIRLQGYCSSCDGDVICDLNTQQLTLLAETGDQHDAILKQYETQLSAPEEDGA